MQHKKEPTKCGKNKLCRTNRSNEKGKSKSSINVWTNRSRRRDGKWSARTRNKSTIDTSVITYNIDGGAWLTYSTPLCSLTGVDVIEVNLVQSYVGGCVDVIRDGEIEFPTTVPFL